ncbi:MAG TPA: diphthine--ammonia ligase [Thermoplasmata archaeon]|nr:diphthine--ammonia ligase [Thermoplasmata archaeon]
MSATALVSGGKDSVFSAYLADTQGREVGELLTLQPSEPDSLMFHTPHLDLVPLQAQAWGKPHREVRVAGAGEAAETEALVAALRGTQGWVVAGAIASSYQWARLLRVCAEVGRPLYAPLWGKEAGRVVRAEIEAGLDIRLVHLAAEPLTPELAGRRLDLALLEELERRSRTLRRVHVAGEGGEFETCVVDAPFFRERIVWSDEHPVRDGGATRLEVTGARLEPKPTPKREEPRTPPPARRET